MLIYASIALIAIFAFAFLAVDWGHAVLAKSQAQDAADAAALYAANGVIGGTPASVRARAVAAASENRVNGTSVSVTSADVEFGLWDPADRTILLLDAAHESNATAVRVTVHCNKARGSAVPLSFGAIMGVNSVDITATATAAIGDVTSMDVPAMASPWLAGMPNGSTVPNTGWNPTPTSAPASSPAMFTVGTIKEFRFASVSGNTTWSGASWQNAGAGFANAEGDPATIASQNAANNINNTKAPLMALMGIYLDATVPNTTAAASALDFTTASSRDQNNYSPGLKQVFYIGDGLNSSGQLQKFKVPSGATRLYVGFMDQSGWWWDNVGSVHFTAVGDKTAVLVR